MKSNRHFPTGEWEEKNDELSDPQGAVEARGPLEALP